MEFTHFLTSAYSLPKNEKKCGILLAVFGRIPIAHTHNQKESRAVNGTKIASKAKAQLANFMGKVFGKLKYPKGQSILSKAQFHIKLGGAASPLPAKPTFPNPKSHKRQNQAIHKSHDNVARLSWMAKISPVILRNRCAVYVLRNKTTAMDGCASAEILVIPRHWRCRPENLRHCKSTGPHLPF